MSDTPRTEAVIDAVMEKFPGVSASAQAKFYEEVHQELAPFARELERENAALRAKKTAYQFDLIEHLQRQQDFSLRTFGPGKRTDGLIDHITKELVEIKTKPNDVEEWVDVVLLALDGAWRAGYLPEEICAAIQEKLERNEKRTWPDWRTAEPGKAIEHVRS